MARIKTTPTVKFALWALRVYLLVLLTLIGVKFVRVFMNAPKSVEPASTVAAPAPTGQSGSGIKM